MTSLSEIARDFVNNESRHRNFGKFALTDLQQQAYQRFVIERTLLLILLAFYLVHQIAVFLFNFLRQSSSFVRVVPSLELFLRQSCSFVRVLPSLEFFLRQSCSFVKKLYSIAWIVLRLKCSQFFSFSCSHLAFFFSIIPPVYATRFSLILSKSELLKPKLRTAQANQLT